MQNEYAYTTNQKQQQDAIGSSSEHLLNQHSLKQHEL